MSNRPFVSVITPTYNRRRFLPILIHLYQEQTYPKNLRELVILDDSPTSNEDLIPKDDPSIRYIYQSNKLTLGEKRNKLNNLAKGEIILCFDDDDYHYPERITHSVTRMNAEKTNIAGCSTINVYYTHIKEMYQYGPFGNNHGTNGTFAFRKSYLKTHEHDPTKNAQEEPSFTNNFTERMSQLSADKTIICISHDTNTFDKKFLLHQKKRVMGGQIKKVVKDKKYINFLRELELEQKQDVNVNIPQPPPHIVNNLTPEQIQQLMQQQTNNLTPQQIQQLMQQTNLQQMTKFQEDIVSSGSKSS